MSGEDPKIQDQDDTADGHASTDDHADDTATATADQDTPHGHTSGDDAPTDDTLVAATDDTGSRTDNHEVDASGDTDSPTGDDVIAATDDTVDDRATTATDDDSAPGRASGDALADGTADDHGATADATAPTRTPADATVDDDATAVADRAADDDVTVGAGTEPADRPAWAASGPTGSAAAGWADEPPVDNSQLPPFGGYRPPPPPPGTGGYATRFGLVRPYQGRYLAGVCGAFARATNTDPVLWRVLFPVTMLAGGLGAIVYLLGWLLIPAEGDSASPIEALAGRGRSSMGRGLTIALAVIASISIISPLSSGFGGGRFFIVGLLLAVLAMVVASRNAGPGNANRPSWWQAPPNPPTGGWANPGAMPGGNVTGFGPGDTPAGPTTPGTAPSAGAGGIGPDGEPTPIPAGWSTTGVPSPTGWTPTNPATAGPRPATGTAAYAARSAATIGPGARADQPLGYRAPFAPHGPFATGPVDDFAFPGLDQPLPPPPPPVGRPPRPAKQPSPAKRVTLSTMLLVLGILAVLDAANVVSVPASGYFAAALATVGLGLVIGAFAGRPRGLVGIGILLSLLLLASSAAGSYHDRYAGGTLIVKPTSIAELNQEYSLPVGKMVVDLRGVTFPTTGQTRLDLHLKAGQIQVLLPPKVDTEVYAKVNLGSTDLLGQSSGGVGRPPSQVTDDGVDGPGGGSLYINAHVNVGEVEVRR